MVLADPDLVLGQDHPVGLDAAQLRLAERRAVWHHRARARHRHDLARGDVGRAADDRARLAGAGVDRADGQAVGIRVRFRGQDVADDEVGDIPDPNVVQPLHLQPAHRQDVGDLLGGHAGVAVLAQPCNRDSHAPNCSSSRASFS